MIRIYIDENMPRQLAYALNLLQQPLNEREKTPVEVVSIAEEFGFGAQDEDWIPEVGKKSGIVITQDYNIQTTRHQRVLCEAHRLGMIYIKPPSNKGLSYWDMVLLLINRWDEIKKIARKEKLPFAFRGTMRGNKFEQLD